MNNNHRIINVLWLVDHLGYGGAMHGASKYYLNTIPLLNKNNFKTILCVLRERDSLTKQFEDKGISISHLGRNKFDPTTLFDILKIIRKEKINIIHAHGYGASNFGRLARMINKTAIIVHAHDDDSKYPFHQKVADFLLGRFTDKAIAVSASVKEASVKKRRIAEEKVLVLHNGIYLEAFSTPEKERVDIERMRLGIKPGHPVVGTVGRLGVEKGIKYLLQAAVQILKASPDTVFLLAGDGPLMEGLKTLSEKLGVDQNVVFAGFCRDIPAVLSIVDIVATPSLTEGSPLAVLEAMAMGKPIVASNVGGIKEILKDGETGLLVPSEDPSSLAEKIIYLIGNQKEAQDLGIRSRAESRKYDIHLHARKLEKQYFDLIPSADPAESQS
jgi:glycosyltransferase involved in cell wall biosynthesis